MTNTYFNNPKLPLIALLLFLFSSCSQGESPSDQSKVSNEQPSTELSSKSDSDKDDIYFPTDDSTDNRYETLWCSTEIVSSTNQQISNLSNSQVSDFLATFNKACQTDSSYTSSSQSTLIKTVNLYPEAVLDLLMTNSSLKRQYILEVVAESKLEVSKLQGLIKKVQSIKVEGSEEDNAWKYNLIRSLNSVYKNSLN